MTECLIEAVHSPETRDGPGETIASRFERQAASGPDNLAIVTDEVSLTYHELNAMADRIAASLGESAPDRPIVLMIDDAPLFIASMIAAAKANRIFIPLESNAPEPWLAGVVRDSGAAHIVSDKSARSIADRVAGVHATVLEVDGSDLVDLALTAHLKATPDSIACIMYTSGSTGRPKGVALTHRGVMYRSGTRAGRPQIRAQDRIAHLRAGGFVPGRTVVFATLFSGACVFPFEINKHGLHRFTPWLQALRITGFTITSSLFRAWLNTLPDDARFPRLRLITCLSEPLFGADVLRAAKHLTGEWIIEYGYGTTEVGRMAGNIMGPASPIEQGILPIGRPGASYEVWLEDEGERILVPGRPGEVIVKTPYIAHGYWNEPELTAATFPADLLDGTRLYRTGDLGRWREDGRLEHLGRKDRRVKLRGYTIELYELEYALLRVPGVRDTTVAFHKGGTDEARLVGYVIADVEIPKAAILAHIAAELPAYMVPSDIVMLKAFPLTISGKIDRAALPPPPEPGKVDRPHASAPSNDIERMLLAIWQEILGVSAIGVDDNFFLMGGDSLKAYQLFAQVSKTHTVDLDLRQILGDASTIAGMARLIESTRQEKNASIPASVGLVRIKADGDRAPLFAVPGIDGNPVQFIHLGHLLDASQPLIGIASRGIDGSEAQLTQVEQIAVDNITRIRSIQPHGPYFLAGACFGGRVAYEMAQQLEAAGERIGLLLLLDPPSVLGSDGRRRAGAAGAPQALRRRVLVQFVLNRIRLHATHLMKLRGANRRAFLREKLAVLCGMIKHRDAFRGDRREFHQRALQAANLQAARCYVPRPYAGPTALCFTRGHKTSGQNNPHQDWLDLVPQVGSATYIAGKDSGDMLKMPHVHELADFVNTSLAAVHANKRSAA